MPTKELIERLTEIIEATRWPDKNEIPKDLESLVTTLAIVIKAQELDIESLEREGDYLRKMIQEDN